MIRFVPAATHVSILWKHTPKIAWSKNLKGRNRKNHGKTDIHTHTHVHPYVFRTHDRPRRNKCTTVLDMCHSAINLNNISCCLHPRTPSSDVLPTANVRMHTVHCPTCVAHDPHIEIHQDAKMHHVGNLNVQCWPIHVPHCSHTMRD